MLNVKSVVSRFILFQSYLIISLVLLGSHITMGQNNFNGSFEIKSLLHNEPVGWFANTCSTNKRFCSF